MKKKLLVYSIIIIIVVVAIIYFFYWKGKQPGKYDDFANCLTEQGFIMAGTDWCHFCKEQKKMFGKSFEFVNYRNCDLNREWCESNDVDSYPTWILPNGTNRLGVQNLPTLNQLSGCDLG